MRKIKFRAWDEEQKMMIYQNKGYTEIDTLFGFRPQYDDGCRGKRDLFIVMQFIGVEDTKSKEMYEGDIVKDNQGNIGEVFYLNHSFAIRWKRKDGSWDTDSCFGYAEVIGNTHQNPELIK